MASVLRLGEAWYWMAKGVNSRRRNMRVKTHGLVSDHIQLNPELRF
jgi:hypothetical protein